MRYIRIFLPWVILLGVAYLGFRYIWPLFLPAEAEMDVQTTVVRRGDLRRAVLADGTLKPAVLVEVKSKASGVVELISAEPGDEVMTGSVLVELDKEQILARQRQAEAGLLSAQASLTKIKRSLSPQQKASAEASVRQAEISFEQAEDQYGRILEIHAKGYATDEELENAKAQLDSARISFENAKEQLELDLIGGEEEDIAVAEANVAIRQAELDDVNEELANTTVRAPIDGTVLSRPVELGTAVKSGTSGLGDGTVVAAIGDLSTLYVQAQIDETELGRVSLGMHCRVTFDAFTGQVWQGELKKIYPQGEGGEGGTRFPVDIELDLQPIADADVEPVASGTRNSGGPRGGRGHGESSGSPREGAPPGERAPELRPGMTASVELVMEDHPDVVILTAQFIQYDEERNPYCEVLPDPEDQDQRERRELELGFTDGMRFEVVKGVEDGETVIFERPVIEE
jgi:multidrug resistance efflux pump